MLTALVVDDHADARRRLTGLLRLGGWQILEAADAESALRRAATTDHDLVVTEARLSGESGAAMLRRMRRNGSTARFLVVTADPTDDVRAEATAAGALACLAKPVDADLLLNFLRSRTTGPAAQDSSRPLHEPLHDLDDFDEDYLDAELMERLHEMYVEALPGRLSDIAQCTTAGDTVRLVDAAHTLAGTSGQLGHPDVEAVCQAIAADARRGILAHARLVQLRELARV
jgi:CheY-like chemotaxis protein